MPRVTVDAGWVIPAGEAMIELDHAGDPPEAPGPVILLMHQLSASTRAELLELAECLRFERDRRDAQDCAAALRVAAE